jgi:competence protein ComEC
VPLPEAERQNDRSVVLTLDLYGRRFLLPGDLGEDGERRVLASLDAAPPRADVLKAGHHGSRTANGTEWLAAWRPREAVISVGRHNLYGHPHPDVVKRLNAMGTAVYRTDRHGEIQYRVAPDGRLERRVKRPAADEAGI